MGVAAMHHKTTDLSTTTTWVTLCITIIAAVSVTYYEPVVRSERWSFTKMWDDQINFLQNEIILPPLTVGKVLRMFTEVRIHVYEPFSWVSKALIVATFGMDRTARGMSLLSLFFHALNSLMLMFISYHILVKADQRGSGPTHIVTAVCCCCASILYAVHPVHAEVVGWASAAPYPQAAAWLLGATYLWLQAYHPLHSNKSEEQTQTTDDKSISKLARRSRKKAILAGAAIGCYAVGILSKAAALPWPIIPAALDFLLTQREEYLSPPNNYYFGRFFWVHRSSNYRYSSYIIVATIGTVAVLGTILANNNGGNGPQVDVIELPHMAQRAAKAAITVVLYLRLLFFPADLRPHHTVFASELTTSSTEALLSQGVLWVLVTTAAAACEAFKGGTREEALAAKDEEERRRYLQQQRQKRALRLGPALALGAYLAFFLPTCGLVQHGMVQKGGDRYAYLPYQVLVPVAALLLRWVVIGCGGGGGGSGMTGVGSAHTNNACTSSSSSRSGGGSGGSAPIEERGRRPEQRQGRAVAAAIVWLAVVCGPAAWCLGSLARAQVAFWADDETMFRRSLAVDAGDWRILDNYGMMLHLSGRTEEAASIIARAEAALPTGTLKAALSRGKHLVILGQTAEACATYQAAEAAWPGASTALAANLAVCHMLDRDFAGAKAELSRARDLAHTWEHKRTVNIALASFAEWEQAGFDGESGMNIMW